MASSLKAITPQQLGEGEELDEDVAREVERIGRGGGDRDGDGNEDAVKVTCLLVAFILTLLYAHCTSHLAVKLPPLMRRYVCASCSCVCVQLARFGSCPAAFLAILISAAQTENERYCWPCHPTHSNTLSPLHHAFDPYVIAI